ncbi:MAG: hypothetical protein BWX72_00079 [Firmicutes bacterium ADurb.Bin080]|nr:MAG: hypothetical protein BWX72_00079 [Firmicutes bacterium ADurb.Bin080]
MKKHEYKVDRFENGIFMEQLKVKAFDPKDAIRRARILYPNSEIRESRKDSNGVYINEGDYKQNG